MTFSLLIIGIVLSVIASLVTLILGIVYIATGKNRSGLILGVSFIMSLIIFLLCVLEIVKRGSGKVKQGIEWMKKYDNENNSSINWNYDEDERDSTMYAPNRVTESVILRTDSLAAIARDSAIVNSPKRK